jgi:hypothetical protein
MRVLALDIPDDPAGLPPWLERLLVGPDLPALAAELAAVHGNGAGPGPLVPEVLGEWLQPVLNRGLAVLPPEVLRTFLLRPSLLLGLQELVFASGGAYWDRLMASPADLAAQVARGRRRLEALWTEGERREEEPRVLPLRKPAAWYRRPWAAALAGAAAVLLAVAAYQRLSPPRPSGTTVVAQNGWGWSKPGALPTDRPAPAYLDALADAAVEWFKKRPEDRAELARRIGEFRQGCSVLILAGHQPLSPEVRDWLVDRCRNWAGELDKERAAVEAGGDVAQVRAEADATVNKLIKALHAKARELAA